MFIYKAKTYTKLAIIFVILFSLVSLSYPLENTRDNALAPEIKVAIGLDLMDASITFPNGGKAVDRVKNKELFDTKSKKELSLRFESNGKFSINGLNDLYSDIRITPSTSGRFKFKGKTYRGYLRIVSKPTGIWVINQVDIEEYLYGVVPYEIPMSWHIESIKAQAVAARTYAIRCLGQYPHNDFDVYDSVKDQVYGGIEGEHSKAIKAVEETRGIILTYQGWPIKAYYHADAGGQTEDGKYIFPGDLPYLKSVPSKDNLEMHRWHLVVKKAEIESLLKKNKHDVGSINDIVVNDQSPTGRPRTIAINGSKRKIELSSNDFRKILGAGRIRSTLFNIGTNAGGIQSNNRSSNIRTVSPDLEKNTIKIISSSGIKEPEKNELSVIGNSSIESREAGKILIITALSGHVYKPKTDVKIGVDEILFVGSGFGHGVGLSQWGSKAYAEDGWDYRRILLHYYNGAELSVWY